MDFEYRSLQKRGDDPVRELLLRERMGLVPHIVIIAASVVGHPIAKELYPPENLSIGPSLKDYPPVRINRIALYWILSEGSLKDAKKLFSVVWNYIPQETKSALIREAKQHNLESWNSFDKLERWLETKETNSWTMERAFLSNDRLLDLLDPIGHHNVDLLRMFNNAIRDYCQTYSIEPPYEKIQIWDCPEAEYAWSHKYQESVNWILNIITAECLYRNNAIETENFQPIVRDCLIELFDKLLGF